MCARRTGAPCGRPVRGETSGGAPGQKGNGPVRRVRSDKRVSLGKVKLFPSLVLGNLFPKSGAPKITSR
ncbi:predicted protein [Streptomyces sp. SPB78]|nr:predicted protein [Streptomyces sp. SPB78]